MKMMRHLFLQNSSCQPLLLSLLPSFPTTLPSDIHITRSFLTCHLSRLLKPGGHSVSRKLQYSNSDHLLLFFSVCSLKQPFWATAAIGSLGFYDML